MSSHIQNKRLLVVDDIDSQMIALCLRRDASYEVDAVSSAASALEMARQHSYDLFLLDGSMPVKDGFTLASELRELGHRQPIIFVTAHVEELTLPHAQFVGACDVVEKPFAPEVLLRSVEKALANECRQF